MTEKDSNYIPKLEKAIAQKYGEAAINNPRRFWDDNKEKDYIEQSQEEQRKFAKLHENTWKYFALHFPQKKFASPPLCG